MFFRKNKPPRYPHRPPLPIIRRKLPMRYHMKHQFGVRDLAFLQTMHALTGSPISEGNRVTILKNGIEIFPSMLAAIRDAKRTINLEFYIYWDGEVGRMFAEALAERARAGVSIKVILDAVGSATMSRALIDFLLRNGLEQYRDYCDHCMGWIGPVMKGAGFVVDHEHNHCGQCWWEFRRASDPSEPTLFSDWLEYELNLTDLANALEGSPPTWCRPINF